MDPPPVVPGPVVKRRTRTRAALLDAAERAFMRNGLHGVSVEALAAEADVSVGSVYGHFSNKEGLYRAVAERSAELFGEYLERAYEVSDSPLEQVMACGDAYLRFHLEHPGAFRFIGFAGMETRPPDVDDASAGAVASTAARAIEGFRQHIAAAVAAGEAGPHVDPDLTSRVLFGAWNGMIAMGLRHDALALDDDAIAACIEQARRIVVEGLTAPTHRTPEGRSRSRLLRVSDERS